MDWYRGYRLYKRIRRLVKKYRGMPLDVLATALITKHPSWRRHVDVCAEALSAYKAAHPGATDRECASAVVARLVRHIL
jgi:hypothetical protein